MFEKQEYDFNWLKIRCDKKLVVNYHWKSLLKTFIVGCSDGK